MKRHENGERPRRRPPGSGRRAPSLAETESKVGPELDPNG